MKKILVTVVAFIAAIALSSFDCKAQSNFFDNTFVDAGIGTNIGRGTGEKASFSLGVGPNSEGNIAFLTGLGAQLSVKLTDRLSLLLDNKFITPFNPKNTGKIPFFELPKSLPLTIGIRYSFSVPVSASAPAPQEL